MAIARDLTDFGLGQMTQREERMGELLLGEAEEEPCLVLGAVGGALENPASTRGVVLVAGVMAGGDAIRSDLLGGAQKLVELEVVVAERAGNRRAARKIVVDEGANDILLEALLLVDDVIRDVEGLGYTAGVIHIIQAAAAARGTRRNTGLAGHALLVPELEGQADDVVSLCAQHGCDGRGVDSAGHGYSDSSSWLCCCSRFECCGCCHGLTCCLC